MTTVTEQKEIEDFFVNKLNINYEKFKQENPHLSPCFYFLLLATRIESVNVFLNKNSIQPVRSSTRKRKQYHSCY